MTEKIHNIWEKWKFVFNFNSLAHFLKKKKINNNKISIMKFYLFLFNVLRYKNQ